MSLFKKKKEVEQALEIALIDHADSFEEAQSFLGFAKTMHRLGQSVKPIPKKVKKDTKLNNAF